MSMACTMSEFNLPFTTTVAPYMTSQYIPSPPTPSFNNSSPMDINSASYQAMPPSPPSPSSSTGSHRVSKAKKGKRVHVCEYPGCSKVFTRAEHRRRHELSHKNKKIYTCTFEGCTKAFHRSDYLSQHVSRHDPHASVIGTPSARSSSISSSSQIPSSSSRTPVMSAFQNIPGSPQIESTNAPDPALVSCSNCFNCQNNGGPCTNDQPIYSYSSPEQMPLTSAPLLSSECIAPQIPTGFDTIIDQYMRSVLRPEAFVSSPQSIPSQSPGPMSPPYWSTNIDPQLPPLHSMGFENSTSYSWTSGAEGLPTPAQSIRDLADNTRSPRSS